MKNRLICILLLTAALCLLLTASALASTVVRLPDQHLTVEMWKGSSVQRTPGTEITRFERDQDNIVYTTGVGGVNGDKVGEAKLFLEEYDTANDIYYQTDIYVTVLPIDRTIDVVWDRSGNTQEQLDWVQAYGNVFAVGEQFSVRTTFTRDGVSLPVTYASNRNDVVTVDDNGLVTMVGAGTAIVTARMQGGAASSSHYFLVHDGQPGENASAVYAPADPSERLLVYRQPDTASEVMTSIGRWEIDHFYVLSRGEQWTRVSCNGYIGYVLSDRITFTREDEPVRDPIPVPCLMYVQASTLGTIELRAEANFRSTVLGKYRTDTVVYATKIVDTFAKVTVDGKTGYMPLAFLSMIEPEHPLGDPGALSPTYPMQVQTHDGAALHLWNQPASGYDSLGEYPNGTVVQVDYERFGDFVKVFVDGKTGYMELRYLAAVEAGEETPSGNEGFWHMIVQTGNTGKLNLREQPKSGTKVLAKYANGTPVVVLQQLGEWGKVLVEGRTGYMMLRFLAPAPGGEALPDAPAQPDAPPAQPGQPPVQPDTPPAQPEQPEQPGSGAMYFIRTGNSGKLNLRAEPKSGAKVLRQLPNGLPVTMLEHLGEWAHVDIYGYVGYVMTKFLYAAPADEFTQPENSPAYLTGTVVHPDGTFVYLRTGPDTSFAALMKIPHGAQIRIVEQGASWWKVLYQGTEGYMVARYLQQ